MKESSRIKFATSSDGGSNTYTATLELKVSFDWKQSANLMGSELQGQGLRHLHM